MRLRVIDIPTRGQVTNPQGNRLHADIDISLQKATPLFRTTGFELRQLEAPSPHTLGKHQVLWLNDVRNGKEIHWDTNSEYSVTQVTQFWQDVESYVRTEQNTHGENLRAYMYQGFILPEWKNGTTAPVVWRGLQSQIRLHMHLSESLPEEIIHDWLDTQTDEKNQSTIGRALNLAGEKLLEMYPKILEGFGETFSYRQPLLGNPKVDSYSRTLTAFPNLETAIKESAQLKKTVSEYWFIMAQSLADRSPQMFAGQIFPLMQSAVPNFVYIIPSEQDMETTGRSAQEVWVAPFSVVGAPEMLTPGGVHLRRAIR